MKLKNLTYKIVASFILMCFCSVVYGQINFFTTDSDDSLTVDFYKRNKKITMLVETNIPNGEFGAAFFIHNSFDRISYFVDIKSNFQSTYIINGVEKNGTQKVQNIVPYTSVSCNVGISRGFTRNWFIYAYSGVVSKSTEFQNTNTSKYSFSIPKHGMYYNVGVGGMYVTDKNYSVMLGVDVLQKSLNIGLGYTW